MNKRRMKKAAKKVLNALADEIEPRKLTTRKERRVRPRGSKRNVR
jgi:hypothetical protein